MVGITPLRSEGGHRRYSRYQLRIAARARELVDQGTPVEAACRIVILEDHLEEARRINAQHHRNARWLHLAQPEGEGVLRAPTALIVRRAPGRRAVENGKIRRAVR